MTCAACGSDEHITHMCNVVPDFGDTTNVFRSAPPLTARGNDMIKPTIGRVVWYWPGSSEGISQNGDQPVPAFICCVWSDTCINVAGFDANGKPFSASSVTLHQDGNDKPPARFAEWMPYQIGQAAKHAAAENPKVDIPEQAG